MFITKLKFAAAARPGEARAVKLADVVAKMNVTLQLADDLQNVQSINLQLTHLSGTIGAIDAKKGTLSLKAGRGNDMNLTLAKDSLDKIAAGAEVNVILMPDRTQVLVLVTPPPVRGERRE